MNIGPMEWVLIFLVVLLLFGAKRLPDIGRSLGKGIREFKRALQGLDEDDDKKSTSPRKPE
jgi:sec-independent protein translocase protein TatA